MESSRITMDTETKISELLASEPVVPDYESKWSVVGRRMQHQTMRKNVGPSLTDKKVIRLDVGQPNGQMSILKDIKVTLTDGKEISLGNNQMKELGFYGPVAGSPKLREWLLELQRREHQPPQMAMPSHPIKFDLLVSEGITHGLSSIVKALLNPDSTDTIIIEEIGYVSFIGALQVHGCNIQGVAYDTKGMDPLALEDILANWKIRNPDKNMPKILYTVASASNPLGYNWDEGRMVDIYRICRKYDLIIIDDGAYYYLQFGKRPRSFQSLDVDGRVVRFDTFSKILGAGYRIGWYSGPWPIMDKAAINHELTCVHASSITQAIVYSMLDSWGPDNFEKHTRSVAAFYQEKARCAVQAFEQHLKGLATWTVPEGGMFIWITINCLDDSSQVAQSLLRDDLEVRMVPGKHFRAVPGKNNSLRFCYSLASDEDLVTSAKELASSIRKILGSEQ